MKRTDIYIGLQDCASGFEEVCSSDVMMLLERFFQKRLIPFSISVINGGYMNKSGGLINENSVKIHLIHADKFDAEQLIRPLKMLLNQETILMTEKDIEVEYL